MTATGSLVPLRRTGPVEADDELRGAIVAGTITLAIIAALEVVYVGVVIRQVHRRRGR
jgi:hypothetical protein